ncbi:hypothetical protein NC651_007251 [Populus alba x Populus x berolinensis]|nr:hypothetical protein NC651_007251 [Populus alba x Populus x berolinensis]
MATAASPMASQLKSSFASSLARRLVIPTAISGAPFRVSPGKRSFTVKAIQSEKAGPLRNTEYAGAAGSLAAGGLVAILSICLTMYGVASFTEGEPSTAPGLTLTGRKKEPDQLQTSDGWAKFSGGFFFGGISGVIWAYFLLYVINLPYYVM